MQHPIEFAEFEQLICTQPVATVLESLANHFRSAGEFHRLFEVRKMQTRHRLGLPVYYTDRPPDTTSEQNRQLEQAVLAACREVGGLLAQAGQVQSAWYYLQPLDDPAFVRQLLEAAPSSAENYQELVEVALYQGAYPELGYRKILEQSGTCNAITTFESMNAYWSLADRSRLADLLVSHLDRELRHNLTRAIEPSTASDERSNDELAIHSETARTTDRLPTVGQRLLDRREAIQGTMPHLDATHLATVVKIGRWTDQPRLWQILVEMCDYGQLLPDSLQYPSDPPFDSTYRDHRLYFQTLITRDPLLAAELFRDKLAAAKHAGERNRIAGAWAELLYRIERPRVAIDVLLQVARQELDGQSDSTNLVTSAADNPANGDAFSGDLLNLATQAPEHPGVADFFRSRNDLLSFSIVHLLRITP